MNQARSGIWLQSPVLMGLAGGVTHGFSVRAGEGGEQVSSENLRGALELLGFSSEAVVAQGEQVHGNRVAYVEIKGSSGRDLFFEGVDALITRDKGVALVIRTADCAPLFILDRVGGGVGLAHSGRRGTEANILGEVLAAMGQHFGSNPKNMAVWIGPCIRPPFYEVDFAAMIREQARRGGVADVVDCGLNTGADLELFFSYRMEKGRTGRHYSVMGVL